MGTVHAEITLKNVKNEAIAPETVTAVVDTGAMSLVITEELRQKLGLGVVGEKIAKIANGQRVSCNLTEAVEVRWKNRLSILSAVVIPGAETILLGAIPLEDMDLIVNPITQELAGAHGDIVEFLAL
jgi:clan AA aspartic protease